MSSAGKLVGIAIVAIIIIIGIGYVVGGSDEGNNETSEAPIQESSELVGEVNIGLILPLSGDLATHGEENWEGSKLGVVDFNKHLEEIDAPLDSKNDFRGFCDKSCNCT